ncbi:cyanophycinase [Pedobacter mucosus]|uniref:cyanophycinase n=1 Tax=Pedobacter mucosus TaxID=2895286 RepID=UPI001EE3EC63|nr:cyanophycinase [Pedobacter mucosus]UKT64222.1 cyanophycinase [Pedobacter mucosus]
MKSQKSEVCPCPTGKLIIIGGAENKTEKQKETDLAKGVLKAFIVLCGENPFIEIITTAGEEAVNDTFEEYLACFKSLGAKDAGHIHHDSRPIEDLDVVERIRKADGVFFSGGDQLKLTAIYGGTQLMSVMKERYIHNGLVIGGTSAGAMAMSTPMIYEGTGQREMVAAGVKVTTGFEFLKDVCIDTHFVHRGRFVRMAQVIATNPASIGIGIEEDTAIVIINGRDAKVIGCGVVIIIDGEKSHGSNITSFDNEKKITVKDLRVSILSEGQKFEVPARNPPHL